MIFSGLWLLVFIIIHVKAFRYGTEYEWPAGGRDLYRLEMENFRNPLMVGFYVLSMLVVGSHLWHGVSSAFQSLGRRQTGAGRRFILPAGKVDRRADRRHLHSSSRSGPISAGRAVRV